MSQLVTTNRDRVNIVAKPFVVEMLVAAAVAIDRVVGVSGN